MPIHCIALAMGNEEVRMLWEEPGVVLRKVDLVAAICAQISSLKPLPGSSLTLLTYSSKMTGICTRKPIVIGQPIGRELNFFITHHLQVVQTPPP